MRRSLLPLSLTALLIVSAACSEDTISTPNPSGGSSSGTSGGGSTGDPLANAQPVVDNYAKNVHANYSEVLATAQALKTAIDNFVASPSQQTHEAAKVAWIAARKPYGPSEVYRFYGGPIDDESTGPEGQINAWPLDENFIDYTRDEPDAGIINKLDVEITKEAIKGKNEEGGEKNIATGYHAIEFLLWGQDDIDPLKKTAGQRPFTDYLTETGSGTASNQARRGTYLKLVAEILVEDLQAMVDAWAPGGADNYARTFVADKKDAVTKMLTGMGSLANAELSGERMTVAYKNKGQEDEHSCFSDTTNADLLGNFTGIENVYLGKYGTSSNSGPGLDTLVKAVDPQLDTQMKADLAEAAAALQAMQAVPFDLAIASADDSPERTNVLKAIQAIKKVANDIVAIGQKLGVTFKLEEPSEDL